MITGGNTSKLGNAYIYLSNNTGLEYIAVENYMLTRGYGINHQVLVADLPWPAMATRASRLSNVGCTKETSQSFSTQRSLSLGSSLHYSVEVVGKK